MKRLWLFLAVVILGAGLAAAQDEGVSLGDAARMQREKKGQPSPNAKVYDNENIPKRAVLSTTSGDFAGIAADEKDKEGGEAAADAKGGGKEKGDKSDADADKAKLDEYKTKIADAKKDIDQLNRELDVMQREQRLRAAAFYGDAGVRTRPENQAKWAEDERKYQADLKAKQDDVNAAKVKLDDLRDEIRKAGLNSSIGE